MPPNIGQLLRSLTARGHHTFQPALNSGFRLANDARDEFGASRNVVDQTLDLAGGPDSVVGIAGRVDYLAAGAGDEFADLLEGRAFLFHRDDLGGDRVFGDARGVAHGAKDQLGFALVVGDDALLDVLMDRAFLRAHETRAHVDAFGAKRKRRDEAASVAEPAGGDHGNFDLVGRHRNQDQARRVVFTGVTGAFKAVDRNRIDPNALGRECMANAGAFVHDLDAVLLEFGDMLLRLVVGGFVVLVVAFVVG